MVEKERMAIWMLTLDDKDNMQGGESKSRMTYGTWLRNWIWSRQLSLTDAARQIKVEGKTMHLQFLSRLVNDAKKSSRVPIPERRTILAIANGLGMNSEDTDKGLALCGYAPAPAAIYIRDSKATSLDPDGERVSLNEEIAQIKSVLNLALEKLAQIEHRQHPAHN